MAPHVREVSREHAVRAFQARPVSDPRGLATPETIAARGAAFELQTGNGSGVFVLERKGDQVWVHGASGQAAEDLTAIGLKLIEQGAQLAGARQVAFSTARRGLVRKAERAGYRVTGWIIVKDLVQ